MKTLFLFHLVFVVLIFFHWTEARRKEAKWIKQENHQLKSEKNNPTKKSLQRKVKDNKSIKVNGSIERHDVLQRKRQFVPDMPFLNFAHPHIHRIIVHHHPGRSLTLRVASSKNQTLFKSKFPLDILLTSSRLHVDFEYIRVFLVAVGISVT